MSKKTGNLLLWAGAALVGAWLFVPPFRLWVAVNLLPAGTVKGATGPTLKVVP